MFFLFDHVPTYQELVAHRAISGSCWIARPSNGSHLATGRPLIHSTGAVDCITNHDHGDYWTTLSLNTKGQHQDSFHCSDIIPNYFFHFPKLFLVRAHCSSTEPTGRLPKILPWYCVYIQCGAVITQSILSQIFTEDTP